MPWKEAMVVFCTFIGIGLVVFLIARKAINAPRMRFVDKGVLHPTRESPKYDLFPRYVRTTPKPECGYRSRPEESEILNTSKHWQMVTVKGVDLYLHSAYLDERTIGGLPPWVRILGMVVGRDEVDSWCHLWVGGIDIPMLSPANIFRIQKLGSETRKNVSAVIVSCRLKPDMPLPTHVTVTLIDVCTNYTSYLSLIAHDEPGVQTCELEFGLCSALKWYEYEDRNFLEWAEYYKLMGVERLNVYALNFRLERPLLQSYAEDKFLELVVVEMPSVFPRELFDDVEAALKTFAMNRCAYSNLYRYCHVVSVGMDEYVAPALGAQDFSGLLASLNAYYGVGPHEASYKFFSNYFLVEESSDLRDNPAILKTSTSTLRTEPRHSPSGSRSVVRLTFCLAFHDFHCVASVAPFHGELGTRVKPELAALYVYQACDDFLFNEPCRLKGMFLVRDMTMRAHRESLISAISQMTS